MIPRLYIDAPLGESSAVPLSAEQVHYLKNVLRRAEGDEIRLFNGADGEFSAEIAELKKKAGLAAVKKKVREQEPEPQLRLLFAPVKRGALENIVQKAVEVGVRRLTPVITERTVAPKLNILRLQSIVTEAAEQCGRMTIPSVDAPIKLKAAIAEAASDHHIVFCDEAGDDADAEWGGREGRATPMLEMLQLSDRNAAQWSVLTGPEGGFTAQERIYLREQDFVTPVTLGPRILRADTAAIAALVIWQAAMGDWRRS